MTNKLKTYLQWRCLKNWPGKYIKTNLYIDLWISNVTHTQCEYFEKEMNNLINRGIYNG